MKTGTVSHWISGVRGLPSALAGALTPSIVEADINMSLVQFHLDDGDKIIQQINLEYSGVHSKASALLTHVSMMIAALSFIFGVPGPTIVKVLILFNILLYLLALLIILRVIWAPTIAELDLVKRRQILGRELLMSQQYLRVAHRFVAALTVMVIILLFADRVPTLR